MSKDTCKTEEEHNVSEQGLLHRFRDSQRMGVGEQGNLLVHHLTDLRGETLLGFIRALFRVV